MRVVILGWDALDLERIEEFELGDQFGDERTKIETFVNPVIDDPHTKELWPSMITGLHPDEHGVHAVAETGVNWDSTLLQTAATLANGVVPQSLLTEIGARLRQRGVGLESRGADYYRENGIETVFDNLDGKAISIPNYETEADRRHEFDANRDELWKELDADKTLEVGLDPQVDIDRVYHLLGRELGTRVGQTIQAMHAGHEVVWTWFGVLDSVGHMEPALGETIVRDWYQVAANVTETIRAMSDEETIVITVSDHGLQDGTHTHYATLCSDHPDPVDQIDHVFDVADYLETADLSSSEGMTGQVGSEDVRDVQSELEALGYR